MRGCEIRILCRIEYLIHAKSICQCNRYSPSIFQLVVSIKDLVSLVSFLSYLGLVRLVQ